MTCLVVVYAALKKNDATAARKTINVEVCEAYNIGRTQFLSPTKGGGNESRSTLSRQKAFSDDC